MYTVYKLRKRPNQIKYLKTLKNNNIDFYYGYHLLSFQLLPICQFLIDTYNMKRYVMKYFVNI